VTRTAARQARPALSGPTSKSMPMAIPCWGRNPANQYAWSECATRIMMTNSIPATTALVAIATESRRRR
jgi:hypothetical protein